MVAERATFLHTHAANVERPRAGATPNPLVPVRRASEYIDYQSTTELPAATSAVALFLIAPRVLIGLEKPVLFALGKGKPDMDSSGPSPSGPGPGGKPEESHEPRICEPRRGKDLVYRGSESQRVKCQVGDVVVPTSHIRSTVPSKGPELEHTYMSMRVIIPLGPSDGD
ncbi:unnamed protein product [Gadus morhua 'NCC']